MNILNALKQLRDDIKTWVTNNLNALNAKIDEKTIPIDSELSSTSTNPVQNKVITTEIADINKRVGDTSVSTQINNAIAKQPHFSGDYNDLTNAPNITEDNAGNMVIADESGNIIFKADAEGIHTTAVSLNGEAAATEKYVDEAIATKVDFTGYATEEQLDNLRKEIGEGIESDAEDWKIVDEAGNIIFRVDKDGAHTTSMTLDGKEVATKEYVEGIIPEVDLTGYATEEYVDDAVASIPTPDVSGQINAHNTNGEAHTDIRQAIEDAKEELSESIVAESDEWKVVDEAGNVIFSVDVSGAHTTELTLNGESAATESYVDDAIANIEFPTTDLTDYATKKYVDDAVNGIEIPDVDFTGYATETYVDNKVADLVNSAPEALDTLGELATALENHEDAYDALLETVGGKATKEELDDLKEELSESIISEADDWKIVDENGNIIFSVDAEGAHTTSMTLNGQSVEDMIGDKVDKVDGKGLSTNDFTDEYKTKLDGLENIEFEETDPTVPAWAKEENKPSYTADEVGALADTTVLADLTDDATHRTVTDAEKQTWNAKSDFSGDYNDLENAPDISEDGSGDLVIADANGNIIFRSNDNGFETVDLIVQNITVNGADLHEIATTGSIYDIAEGANTTTTGNKEYLVFYCGTATDLID